MNGVTACTTLPDDRASATSWMQPLPLQISTRQLGSICRELTTLWVVRLDDSVELKVTDPKEQQRDVEEEEAEGKERRDWVD